MSQEREREKLCNVLHRVPENGLWFCRQPAGHAGAHGTYASECTDAAGVVAYTDALTAQLSALRPVLEAARKWAIHADGTRTRLNERETALREALRTYESQPSENPAELKP